MIWEIADERTIIEGLDESGRPDPAYAASLGLKPAPFGRRALSSIIEFAFYAFLQLPYWLVALPSLLAVVTGSLTWAGFFSHPNLLWMLIATGASFAFTTAFIVVQIILHGRRGVTLGKAFTGIRSVNVATLEKPGFGRALLRAFVLYVAFLVPLVGPVLLFVSVFFDSEKRGRGWLDKVGRTWFVDIRQGLDPYHEKRMRVARKTVAAVPQAAKTELPSLATPLDRSAPVYRPGARVSSGVVGAARPQAPGAEQVGLPSAPVHEAVPSETAPGMPSGGARLGAYRPGSLSGATRDAEPPAPSAPRPAVDGIVDSLPWRDRPQTAPTAPQQVAPAAAPQVAPAAPQQAAPAAPQQAAPPANRPTSPAPAAPAAPAASAPTSAISDDTVIEPDLDEGIDDRTVRRIEVVDDGLDATRARPAARPTIAVLAFDNGERLAITGSALIGRNPAPAAGEEVEHLLPIADETRSISKTHLLLTAAPLAAIDRASTNGSSVVRGGVEQPLVPGEPYPLAAGDVVRFGDRSVTVEPGAEQIGGTA